MPTVSEVGETSVHYLLLGSALFTSSLVALLQPACADQAPPEPVALRLRVVRPVLAFGEEPDFEVLVINNSSAPVVLALPVEALPVAYDWEVEAWTGAPPEPTVLRRSGCAAT